MPLIQALRRQRQAYLCEFKVSLVYKVSFKTARAVTQRNSVSDSSSNNKMYSELMDLNSDEGERKWH